MAKIYKGVEPDIFGEGYKTEIQLDNGEVYKIETTPEPDIFGGGYKKQIVKANGSSLDLGWRYFLGMLILGGILFAILFFFGDICEFLATHF